MKCLKCSDLEDIRQTIESLDLFIKDRQLGGGSFGGYLESRKALILMATRLEHKHPPKKVKEQNA